MYQVYCDEKLIYDPRDEELSLLEAKVTLEVNAAGYFEFKLPPDHPYYALPQRMLSRIKVLRDGVEVFKGRPTEQKVDYYRRKYIYCEGELAFLNDSIQRPAEYHDMSVRGYLDALVNNHNSQVEEDKRFIPGIVTVRDPNNSLYRYTNYNSTMTEIKEDLIDDLGGYIRIRNENGNRYLDYIDDYDYINSQVIRLDENLTDFTGSFDWTEIATAVIPLGARLEESPIEALEQRLTIESVNGGKDYVYSEDAVSVYGWILKTVTWDNVNTPEILLSKARKYLSDYQFDQMVIEAKAVDLHYVDGETEPFRLGDKIRVISKPHALDRVFPLSKMTINLNKPSENTVTLGTTVSRSLTAKQNSVSASIKEVTESVPSMSTAVKLAVDQASALITAATHGNVVTTANEQLIMDTDDVETAEKLWRWNLNGLGYSKTGYNGRYETAITMDGAVVADRITAGKLNADIIKTGKLQDTGGNTTFDLSTGTLTIKKGSINLGGGKFSVDTSGYLTSTSGKIGGFTINSNSIYNDILTLNSKGLTIKESGYDLGYFGSQQWHNYPSHKGITMSLEYNYNPRYVVWANMDHASDDYYTVKLAYASKSVGGGSFKGDRISLGCNLDGNNWTAENLWIDPYSGGASAGINSDDIVAIPTEIDSSGTVLSWIYARIRNGFLC